MTFSCNKDYLEIEPIGSVNISTLATKYGVNGVLIGAYSLLDGRGAVGGGQFSRPRVLATMASEDAHVGGSGNSHLTACEFYQHYPITPATGPLHSAFLPFYSVLAL